MKQFNQIGKTTKKVDFLMAKKGKIFVTPKGKSYVFDFEKVGRKYYFIISYMDSRMRILESEFNRTHIDHLLTTMEKGLSIK